MLTMLILFLLPPAFVSNAADNAQYKLLATNKTSTMEKEMNRAAGEGYRFEGAMGGETAAGGNEMVVIMSRAPGENGAKFSYKLLATNKTSTMEKELNEAGRQGYLYNTQTIYNSSFGGREVVVILERTDSASVVYEYKLLATSRTSTMEKELNSVAGATYAFCGVTVAETAFGGREVVSIMRKAIEKR